MVLSPGVALFIPSGPSGDHLFVIVFGPKKLPAYGDQDQFLLVPICTAITGCSHECRVPVGCHPFVTHDSYADFAHAQIRNTVDLCQNVETTLFRLHPVRIDQPTLQEMIDILPRSKQVRRFINKDFFGDSR